MKQADIWLVQGIGIDVGQVQGMNGHIQPEAVKNTSTSLSA